MMTSSSILSQSLSVEQALKAIDRPALSAFLESQSSPCYESRLLRFCFPELDILKSPPIVLYQRHFALFYALYRLEAHYRATGRYLHIHFMRIGLFDLPASGACQYFDSRQMRFCPADTDAGDDAYCAAHRRLLGADQLERLSLRWFYLDAANYERLDEETAGAFMQGTWDLLAHYETYRECLEILGMPEAADRRMIRQAFYRLARQYHPDVSDQPAEAFKRINRAYQFLLRLTPV